MTIHFNKTHPEAQCPFRAYPGDAGFDLFVCEEVTIMPGQFADVPIGVRVIFPPLVFGRIVGRSSTLRKRNLLVVEGIIDNGYRGDLFVGVRNLDRSRDDVLTIHRGDRIAQLLLHENIAARHQWREVPAPTFEAARGDGRGTSGFGSTGVSRVNSVT